MKVRYDEGVANRIGPEPCAGVHEGIREGIHGGVGEASVGECIGQPLSRERPTSRVPTPFSWRKATRYGHDSASVHMARRGRRTWHVQTLLVSGNRESSRSTARSKAAGPHREGEEP